MMGKKVSINRKTNETDIKLELGIGSGERIIETGVGFFDHMINSFAVHGGFNINLDVKGDLNVDCHHTIEDVGIVLGLALKELAGDKSGIARFGSSYVPMDEALAFCAVDISGRAFLVYDGPNGNETIGEYDVCMTKEFFRALAFNAGITLHIKVLYGENLHHEVEALFKAVARALNEALKPRDGGVLSAKGVL